LACSCLASAVICSTAALSRLIRDISTCMHSKEEVSRSMPALRAICKGAVKLALLEDCLSLTRCR
jgi:hypothetical protein